MKSPEEEIEQELEVLVDGGVDTAPVSQSQEAKSFEGEEDNTDSVKEEDQETKDDASNQRLHAAKVGLFDVLLYVADVVSDGLACAKHYWNCHKVWAGATAGFMLLPAFAEALETPRVRWLPWIRVDPKFRIPMSLVVIAVFIALFVPLFYDYFTINESIVLSIYTAFVVSVAMVFVISARNTLKGFAALMKKEPNEDGTVDDPKMLDGVRGKLNEVVCEAAPQGNLQVRLREGCRKSKWKFKMAFAIRRPTPLPLMAQISRHFLPHFFSFAIESYIYETDFTLQKYHS